MGWQGGLLDWGIFHGSVALPVTAFQSVNWAIEHRGKIDAPAFNGSGKCRAIGVKKLTSPSHAAYNSLKSLI
jgi:hypothetical protein